jgi:hypothetical protein
MTSIHFARAAEAMLRALGGAEITLCFPAQPAADQTARELGLAEATVQEIRLAPVVVRAIASSKSEFLVSAPALTQVVEQRQAESVPALLDSCVAMVWQGRALRLVSVTPEFFAGTAYLYRIIAAE